MLAEQGYEIVALSGTSGGAVCAFLAWFGLTRGDPALGTDLLEKFWRENAASDPFDRAINTYLVATSRLEHVVALPAISPYQYPGGCGATVPRAVGGDRPPERDPRAVRPARCC
ncbi:MAG: hypothetical protein M3O70_23755 [Actinomycetota bacterium]|nr:hypothetical protein [Actinomycetota bacterium]